MLIYIILLTYVGIYRVSMLQFMYMHMYIFQGFNPIGSPELSSESGAIGSRCSSSKWSGQIGVGRGTWTLELWLKLPKA